MIVNRPLILFAAFNGALAILLGAFAAHGAGPQIKTLLTTGSHYQLVHAVFGLVCAIWLGGGRLAVLTGWLGAGGGLVFSLALAAVGLAHMPIMGAVAPIGGLMMIVAWLLAGFAAFRSPPEG